MQVKAKEIMIKSKEDEKGNLKACIENEKKDQDAEFSKLRRQLDEQKTLISNQRKLLNKLQVLNEVTQGAITQSSQELANKVKEKSSLSLQINDQTREQEKLRKRHNYLANEIKNCIPNVTDKDGTQHQKYNPSDVTILADQRQKFNVPNQQYVNVNRYNIKSQHPMFAMEAMPIEYGSIREDH